MTSPPALRAGFLAIRHSPFVIRHPPSAIAVARLFLILAVLFIGTWAGIFGFGWWHASTHATFYMDLRDVATPSKFDNVKNSQIEFLDEGGKVLARGKTDGRVGVVAVSHPTAGYCEGLVDPQYRKCFDAHTDWLLTWVPQVRAVSIVAGQCRIERAPVQFSASRESPWLWWVPLPHIGGMPYTHFNASLQIDGQRCALIPPRA